MNLRIPILFATATLTRLPHNCMWYADPAGANEIAELRVAGFKVRRGINDLRLGIAAVSARVEHGRLRILQGRCPNLITEAGMYRWGESEDRRAEVPVDEHNHALAALRYMVAAFDKHKLGRRQGAPPQVEEPTKTPEELAADAEARRYGAMLESDDPRIWWAVG